MNGIYSQVGEGIIAIDTEYVRPHLDASHLIVDDGQAAFVDTGTYFSVPNLLATLSAHGLDVDDVAYILLTHIHLDHAGGAAVWRRRCRARVCWCTRVAPPTWLTPPF